MLTTARAKQEDMFVTMFDHYPAQPPSGVLWWKKEAKRARIRVRGDNLHLAFLKDDSKEHIVLLDGHPYECETDGHGYLRCGTAYFQPCDPSPPDLIGFARDAVRVKGMVSRARAKVGKEERLHRASMDIAEQFMADPRLISFEHKDAQLVADCLEGVSCIDGVVTFPLNACSLVMAAREEVAPGPLATGDFLRAGFVQINSGWLFHIGPKRALKANHCWSHCILEWDDVNGHVCMVEVGEDDVERKRVVEVKDWDEKFTISTEWMQDFRQAVRRAEFERWLLTEDGVETRKSILHSITRGTRVAKIPAGAAVRLLKGGVSHYFQTTSEDEVDVTSL